MADTSCLVRGSKQRVCGMQVLPLQVASLALVSLPWTLPRLLDLQAANPAAVLDGMHCSPLISLGQTAFLSLATCWKHGAFC